MKSEKRMVGDYTVLCAVNIGSREIILAENEQDKIGERFLCCYGERNDIFQRYSECAVGDDYIDAALFFAERIKRDAELFRSEVEKLDIPVTVITQADCIPDHYKNDINGKVIAINPAVLKPEYRRADRQLYLVTGGFGASANSRGSAVFCTNLYDGKPTRYERMDVMGEVKTECMPHWAVNKATVLKHIQGNKLIRTRTATRFRTVLSHSLTHRPRALRSSTARICRKMLWTRRSISLMIFAVRSISVRTVRITLTLPM